jgi:aspartyl-tRNA(Asn)/glutamyl-tRNA(Gln) amidotransferase subunit A
MPQQTARGIAVDRSTGRQAPRPRVKLTSMSTDPADLSATALTAAYRARSLSPVEATEAILARIAAWDDRICATWALDPDAARSAAKASESRYGKGAPAGPLDGVPVTIKENIATRGVPLPAGTAAKELTPAEADAPPAARLREGGAVILGKTTMPDFGMLSSGLSSFHRLTRNPWDLALNPGGSSAGAAASAAVGYGPIHIGTDIGGSIRLPAAACGVVGLKPSFGRIPIDPPFPGRVAGPITRTVADAALAMSVLSAADMRDYMSLPPAAIDWDLAPLDLQGLRIGFCADTGLGGTAAPELMAAAEAAAKLFEAAGAIVEPVVPYLRREMVEGLDRFWRTRFRADLAEMAPERRAMILPYILAWIDGGGEISGNEVFRGFSQIGAMAKATVAATAAFDFVLSPVWTASPFPADWASPLNDPARPFDHIAYCVAYNMSEQPALSINCGYTSGGAPIGLQIAGRRFDDAGVLRLAAAYEAMRPASRAWPRLNGALPT